MKKSAVILAGVGLVISLLLVWHAWSRARYAAIERRLAAVRIGMSRAEVLAVVGKPEYSKTVAIGLDTNGLDTLAEIWVFPHSASASEFPRCAFGGSNGTVVQVVVGGEYRR